MYYAQLRMSFLQDMTREYSDRLQTGSLEALAEELPGMISGEIESISSQYMRDLIDQVQTSLGKKLSTQDNDFSTTLQKALKEAIDSERATKSDKTHRLHNFQDRFSQIVHDEVNHEAANYAFQKIVDMLQQQGFIKIGKNSGAELGFVKRNLLMYFASQNSDIAQFYKQIEQRVFSDHSLIGYAKNLGGAYAEEMEVGIINKLIQQLNGKKNMFSTTAAENDSTNLHYDLISQKISKQNTSYFNNLQQFLDNANIHLAAENTIDLSEVRYGIQSKQGWSSSIIKVLDDPKEKLKSSFFSVGDRKELANSLGFNVNYFTYRRGWHVSVLQLSKLTNIFQVLGQFQLGYFVQGRFIWMADLISTMHKHNLYLSFYYSKILSKDKTFKHREYPTTGEVAWQAPEYDYKELSRVKILQQAAKRRAKTKKK